MESQKSARNIGVLLPAGGSSSRIGKETPKQFLHVNGKPVFQYSLELFHQVPEIAEIVVVLPRDYLDKYQHIKTLFPKTKVVEGGTERWESVKKGFEALDSGLEGVLIHDVARPFLSYSIVQDCIESLHKNRCAVVAQKTADTTKEVDGDKVVQTHNRQNLISVQTPQAFPARVLQKLYEEMEKEPQKFSSGFTTDEAGMVEQIGETVYWIEGSSWLKKITLTEDLLWAKWAAELGHYKDKN